METQTSICNKALGLVGGNTINSIEDNTQEAIWCKNYYNLSFNIVLSEGAWKHSTTEQPLTKVSTEEYSEEQKYVYNIPTNCVLINNVYHKQDRKKDDNTTDWIVRYIPENNKSYIVCDKEKDMYIEYVYNNSNLTQMSSKFVQALVAKLASNIAMPITHDMNRMLMMTQLYDKYLKEALESDYNETGEEKLDFVSPITKSRGFYK